MSEISNNAIILSTIANLINDIAKYSKPPTPLEFTYLLLSSINKINEDLNADISVKDLHSSLGLYMDMKSKLMELIK